MYSGSGGALSGVLEALGDRANISPDLPSLRPTVTDATSGKRLRGKENYNESSPTASSNPFVASNSSNTPTLQFLVKVVPYADGTFWQECTVSTPQQAFPTPDLIGDVYYGPQAYTGMRHVKGWYLEPGTAGYEFSDDSRWDLPGMSTTPLHSWTGTVAFQLTGDPETDQDVVNVEPGNGLGPTVSDNVGDHGLLVPPTPQLDHMMTQPSTPLSVPDTTPGRPFGRMSSKDLRKRALERIAQRHQRRQGPYAGGTGRARELIPTGNVELPINTNPIASEVRVPGIATSMAEDAGPLPAPVPPEQERRSGTQQPGTGQRDRIRNHRAYDLTPYQDDFFSFLNCEDYPNWHPEDDLIIEESDLPPEARKCPKEVRRLIRNAHRNLGHPSSYALVRLMKTAKCQPEMISYARYMKCPTCLRRQPPVRIPKATMPYRPSRFNAIVGMDLKWIKESTGKHFYGLNILDLATTFNVFVIVPNKLPGTIADAFKWAWMNWAGAPDKIVVDRGREFYTDFQEVAQKIGAKFRMVPTEAPWQNGMVERHGGVLGDIVQATVMETGAIGADQMTDVCLHASMAKNRRPGKTGFSPRTLIFGVDERLIASGLNHYLEEPDDASITRAAENPDYLKSMNVRKSAMKAVIDLDHSTKWAEAIKFPSRPAEVQLFLPGNQVFFWKAAKTNQKGKRARLPERWHGPAVVIGHEWDQQAASDSYWVSSGTNCYLIAGQHLRHAELEELMSQELVVEKMKQALIKFGEEHTPWTYEDWRQTTETPFHDGSAQPPSSDDPSGIEVTDPIPLQAETGTADFGSSRTNNPFTPSIRMHHRVSRAPRSPLTASVGEPDEEMDHDDATGIEDPSVLDGRAPMDLGVEIPAGSDIIDGQELASRSEQQVYYVRGLNQILIVDENQQEVNILKWKTFNKNQRKGRELDSKYFNEQEQKSFAASDAKEWQSFIDTGAVVVIPPSEVYGVNPRRIFKRAARWVRTNKNKDAEGALEAKSRLITPGDVDPDGDTPVEEGGFRTDAPTAPQIGLHLLLSYAARNKWKLKSFDVSTAFLSGKYHDR